MNLLDKSSEDTRKGGNLTRTHAWTNDLMDVISNKNLPHPDLKHLRVEVVRRIGPLVKYMPYLELR